MQFWDTSLYLSITVDMVNISTKTSLHDDGLVSRLYILINMQQELDLSSAIYGTILCPRTQGHNSQGIIVYGICCPKYTLWRFFVTHDRYYVLVLYSAENTSITDGLKYQT